MRATQIPEFKFSNQSGFNAGYPCKSPPNLLTCSDDPLDVTEKIYPSILVAAQEAGIKSIYRLGGATAIATVAYETQTFLKVEVITETGELEFTLAKKMVDGTLAIDTLLDAFDLVIIPDRKAYPDYGVADLFAHIEQNHCVCSILFYMM